MTTHDTDQSTSSEPADPDRRRLLQALGVGAAVTAFGSGTAAASRSADDHDIDPNFGYTALSPDDDLPVDPDHEVELLIRPRSDGPIPEFFFSPTGLFVERGDTVAFHFTTPDHAVTAYHPFVGRQQRIPDRRADPGFITSPMLGSGAVWLFTFDEAGVYDFFCPPHEVFGMAMRIVVGKPTGPGASTVPDPCMPGEGEGEGGRPPGLTSALILRDPALAPERIVRRKRVEWDEIREENKQLFVEIQPPAVCQMPDDGSGSGATAYQVDFVGGRPEQRLGEDGDDFYNAQRRLIRFLHGSSEDPVVRTGGGSDLRSSLADCVRADDITVDHSTATVDFRVREDCRETLSLASYVNAAGAGVFDPGTEQPLFDGATGRFGPGRHSLTVALPGAPFVARLAGENEVPPVESDGSGIAWFSPNEDGTWHYHLLVRNVENVTQAHIHRGEAGTNGPVVTFLAQFTGSPDGTGGGTPQSATHSDPINVGGTIEDTALVEEIAANPAGFYVNVHTTANPSGEIRGQLEATE